MAIRFRSSGPVLPPIPSGWGTDFSLQVGDKIKLVRIGIEAHGEKYANQTLTITSISRYSTNMDNPDSVLRAFLEVDDKDLASSWVYEGTFFKEETPPVPRSAASVFKGGQIQFAVHLS